MKFFEFIQKALSEDNGNPSSSRLNLFIAIIFLIPAVTFTLVYVVITAKDLVTSVLTAVLAFLAALYGLKQYGKGKEQEVPPTPSNAPDGTP